MNNNEMGYLIEYSEKSGFLEPIGDQKKALVTHEKLIEMLQNKYKYMVWNAHIMNLQEYKQNHEPGTYEDLTEE